MNYIIARTEILSTLGVVAALVMFCGGGDRQALPPVPDSGRARRPGKESGAMFAPLLLVYVTLFECGCSLRICSRREGWPRRCA